jgi:co-chaperonin GroES (HSP10)
MYSTTLEVATEGLPVPRGYKLLVAMPQMQEKTSGGIFLPDERKDQEKTASIFGKVLAVGDEAYVDVQKFPSGPWCEEGDWVIFRSYSGTRFKVNDQEYRLINDDTVEGVVSDPSKIERV